MMEDDTVYRSSRLNALAAAAFIVVLLCIIAVVYLKVSDEFAKNTLMLVLGRFLGYVDNVYSFEFGTTRGSKAKDDTINSLAAGAPTATVTTDKGVKDEPRT